MTTIPAQLDILSLIEQHAHITMCGRSTRHYRHGIEQHSDCPWCQGKDRFVIWPEAGRYYCRVCGKFGDSINFLRDYEGMSYFQACSELDIDPRYPEEALVNLPLVNSSSKDEPPPKRWSEAAEAFVWRAERYLWSPGGKRGLDYLREKRGLTDDTIRRARIGFCPDWFSESFTNWGLSSDKTDDSQEIKIPEGIVIPWFVENKVWKLSVRRPDRTYYQVLGSVDALYGVDDLQPGQPAMLLESEFDALSAMQEAGDLAAMVATGGTAKGRTDKWIAALKKTSHVLVAFDCDEAGEHGANEWLKVLPNAFRWLPWSHDCNDMLKQGLPVRTWVELGLQTAHVEIPTILTEILIIPPEVPTKPTEILTPTPAVSGSRIVVKVFKPPLFPCRFCHVRKWIWYQEDKEFICVQCYSPASWTQP